MARPEAAAPDEAPRELDEARLVTVTRHPGKLRDFYLAAGKALREPLAERDAVIVYARIDNFGAINRDPSALLGERPLAAVTDAKRVILVIDHANEGLAFNARFSAAMVRLRDENPDRHLALVHVQNNARLQHDVAALDGFPWCVFGTFHYHMWLTLSLAATQNTVAEGDALLRRVPEKAILCFNNAPRLHRMLTLLWLYKTFPREDFIASFGGMERSKHNVTRVFRKAAGAFQGATDLAGIVGEVEALGVPGIINAASFGAMVHRPDVKSHADTLFSFVTESDMTAGEIERFTEKSIKPLAMAHPVVIAGNPWTVRALERLGFDLLRDEIDHDYDTIAEPEERLNAAFRAAERLARLAPEERRSLLRRNRERLAHNVEQFDGRLLARLEAVATDEALGHVVRALRLWDGHPRP